MVADSLKINGSPIYSSIIYSRSIGEDDETNSTVSKALKTQIIQVPPSNPMEFLNKHLQVKKYYAIYKYVMNNFKEPNKPM
jgi:hypothetical protein